MSVPARSPKAEETVKHCFNNSFKEGTDQKERERELLRYKVFVDLKDIN